MSDAESANGPDMSNVQRTMQDGFFPNSPYGTRRESIVSEFLSTILDRSPNHSVADLEQDLKNHPQLKDDEVKRELVIGAFREAYTTTGEKGARGSKEAQRYLIPFHPVPTTLIKPEEPRYWGRWYILLMTNIQGDTLQLNEALHRELQERLRSFHESNAFEAWLLSVLKARLPEDSKPEPPDPIRPYILGLSKAFQQDISAHLADTTRSGTQWLEDLGDIARLYILMGISQTARNLKLEFDAAIENRPFTPTIHPIHFGLWGETAGADRPFSSEWTQPGEGYEQNVYDSWGRLGALRLINEAGVNVDGLTPMTLTEALNKLQGEDMQAARSALLARLDEDDTGQSLAKLAETFSRAVSRHYSNLPKSRNSAYSGGEKAIKQLGAGQTPFVRTQRGVGMTYRLNARSLRLLARLFALGQGDAKEGRYAEFREYMRERGINFDPRTDQKVLDKLQAMGFLERLSDSGDAVYVRSS